ncbi:hypothetical protein AAAT49_06335 [Agathobacter rectalis]|uniref:hypothetical protein n=1 Tax=Agathobacter rectalis TaxID=39491 RepID=UPI0032C0E6BA
MQISSNYSMNGLPYENRRRQKDIPQFSTERAKQENKNINPYIEELTNLEIIKLQDLKHVNCLPDLRKHANLQRLFIIDTGIDIKELPNYLQEKVSNWDDR